MSSYYEDDRPRRHRSTRERRRPAEFVEEVYESRGVAPRTDRLDLVRRRDSSVSSVEEVPRAFPPGDAYVRRRTVRESGGRRARSADRGRHGDDYYREEYRDSRKPRYSGRGK